MRIVYELQVCWKENEVLFQSKLNIKQKKRVFGLAVIVLFVDF